MPRTVFLTTPEVALRLGVNTSRVRQLIAEGRLPARKIGRDWVVEEESLKCVSVRVRTGRPKKQA